LHIALVTGRTARLAIAGTLALGSGTIGVIAASRPTRFCAGQIGTQKGEVVVVVVVLCASIKLHGVRCSCAAKRSAGGCSRFPLTATRSARTAAAGAVTLFGFVVLLNLVIIFQLRLVLVLRVSLLPLPAGGPFWLSDFGARRFSVGSRDSVHGADKAGALCGLAGRPRGRHVIPFTSLRLWWRLWFR